MDTTPNPKMFQAMQAFTDATCGEAPLTVEKSPAAEQRRRARRECMDFLHRFAAACMRDGVGRYLREQGRPTKPNSRLHVSS